MSSISFSGALSSPLAAAQTSSVGKTESLQPTSPTKNQASGHLQNDTVKLSIAAQAKLMHRQGLSPSVIAANLGTNVASIDGYLNIKVPTQTTAATTSSATTESKPTSTSTPTTEAASMEASGPSSKTAAATANQTSTATQAALVKS